jgi:YVTN family beta-propeller protein
MQTQYYESRITHHLLRLRFVAAILLFVAAAALAATAMMQIRLPWAAPVITVGTAPVKPEVDVATNTIYVANPPDNTISVIDGARCNADNSSHCAPVAVMTDVGFAPGWLTFDRATKTLYVVDSANESGGDGNQVAVLNVANCNSKDVSGCDEPPVALVTVGDTGNGIDIAITALDPALHTLYVGDVNFGPLSMIDTATCNALQTSGCNHVVTTTATGLGIAIDSSNHSVYVGNLLTNELYVFNGTTCNANTQSDCSFVSVAPLPEDYHAYQPAIDPSTHSIYLPLFANTDVLGYVAVIDGSACNGIDHSGCGKAPRLVQAGSLPLIAVFDSTSRTVYVSNEESASLSVINAATCNGLTPSGCPSLAPALATGVNSIPFTINPRTHTIYCPSMDTNSVWVLDASQCNGQHPEGCTKFAPATLTGAGTQSFANNPDTHTLYVSNQLKNTVSIIDTQQCNQIHTEGCHHKWPKFGAAVTPRFMGLNRTTNTIYLGLRDANALAVINGATCNSTTTAGCSSLNMTAVGTTPQQIAIDEATNTIYVANQDDNTVSVIDGTHCNGTDNSGCSQSWSVAIVGASPQALTFSTSNKTLYVTNTDDNSVSVIDATHCNATDTSACMPVATFPAGSGPRAIGVVTNTNTIFVANRDDLTISIIDGSICNGSNTSGCPQVAPPAVLAGAFPETGGIGNNLLGREVAIDQQTQFVFLPVPGDSDMVYLDGNSCTASNLNGCRVQVIPRRMGGFPITAAVDENTRTVYVANDTDGTVSIVPEPR